MAERNRVGRPKTPLISRQSATLAALAVIDADGLDNFSLGAVARHLNVKAPSLYYHFKDKSEVLSEVARLILLDTGYQNLTDDSWEEQTIKLCVETRRTLLRHPNAAPLILQFFPRHLMLDAYELAVARYPQKPAFHMAMLEGIEKLTFGDALFEAAARARGIPSMPPVDVERFPNLAQSVAANQFDDEGVFVEALQMLLAGIHVRAAAPDGTALPSGDRT